ncbi:cysteine proteinase [Gymnopus androsaceus JB14]|uniref:ubiquitinyl hydrolase 1 n=1 Tax=Gymnopus androsaceus JB14 TaxID=1447944 RepID=A0A6A4HVB8_9AGAR|nr:cysteine proteinase [Gymnopus androsaceus JB14]
MANPYINPSYYDQSGPVSYAYNNQAGPSSSPYPYQYGVNGHAYQNYHPQQQYIHPQDPAVDGKQSQNFAQPPYPYYPPPPTSAWQQAPEIHSPLPKQLSAPPPEPNEIIYSPNSHPSPPPASPPVSPTDSQPPNFFSATWAVWSRRPTDPNLAPGLVFSSRTRPPDHIMNEALDVRTPPASPVVESASLPVSVPEMEAIQEQADTPLVEEHVPVPIPVSDPSSASASAEETSTTATETPSTTLPGSPASSTTSISASGNAAVSKDVPSESSAIPAVATSFSSDPASSRPISPSPPQPLKKSWASLLRPATAPGPGTPSTPTAGAGPQGRPKIPMSTVVGFSVPAEAAAPGTNAKGVDSIAPGKRADLLALLNSNFLEPVSGSSSNTGKGISYAAASATATKKSQQDAISTSQIHPRGLINTGNMCFANSVLQLLAYSPPFFRVFRELERLGFGSSSSTATGSGGLGVVTPLIDATVTFLDEFLPEEKEKKARAAAASSSSSSSSSNANGVSSSGSISIKGKERERSSPIPEDEFSPFIPTSIYDALKSKKQFDSMMRGGGGHQQQQDAEEFLGFYLDGLEEELEEVKEALMSGSKAGVEGKAKRKAGGNTKEELEETEEEAPPEAEEEGWLEVGKKNRTVVTRTASFFSFANLMLLTRYHTQIKSTDSPIARIFGGKFRSSLRVPGQKESAIVEDWRSLRLDIQRDTIHTIQDALSAISHPQTVHLTDPPPPKEGSQQVLIEALPPVLVLHMKRFEYDAKVGGVVKVGKLVTFGPELVVGADVLTAKARSKLGMGAGVGVGAGAKGVRYKLFGAIYHHGISASGGHYTLDVLHPDRYHQANTRTAGTTKPREGWIRIDDDLVSDVRPEDVFGQGDFEDSGMRCPYLLFYRRV